MGSLVRVFRQLHCYCLWLLYLMLLFTTPTALSQQIAAPKNAVDNGADELLAMQNQWREISANINRSWVKHPDWKQSPHFQTLDTEEALYNSYQSENTPNFYAIEYLLFGDNNNRILLPLKSEEAAQAKQLLTTFNDVILPVLLAQTSLTSLTAADYQRLFNEIIEELTSAMGESIASANPVFLSERYSWQTVESYFWRIAAVENALRAQFPADSFPKDLEKQFIKVYRRLVGISYSQYLKGASALFKAKGNHNELAKLIDHDDQIIALVNQIKSVSGRKKIQKFITELQKLLSLIKQNQS